LSAFVLFAFEILIGLPANFHVRVVRFGTGCLG
jgi:hypothetical protein